jgi:hypothetical protein
MIGSDALRLQLVQDIINLPDDLAPLVQDSLAELNEEYPAGHDPILDYIGGVSHGSLSANIDDELYGEAR